MGQFLRKVQLIIGDASGTGLDVSELHIKFTVRNATSRALKSAAIRIYNLSDETIGQIQAEFTQVFLLAGYQENFAQIFQGTIGKFIKGKENATDTFLDIFAFDGDTAYNWTVMNQPMAAGWTAQRQLDAIVKAMNDKASANGESITTGYIPNLDPTPAIRAKSMFGMARDHLDDLAKRHDAVWFIEDGQVNILPIKDTLPGQAVVLNYQTGLIGFPEQTNGGIVVHALLNPQIKVGVQIQLNSASITQATVVQQLNIENPMADYYPSISKSDGFYVVRCLTHEGDTRGTTYQTVLICEAVDGTSAVSGPAFNAVPDAR